MLNSLSLSLSLCVGVCVCCTGTAMWIGMNSTDGLSHAIVNVECVDGRSDISRAETVR